MIPVHVWGNHHCVDHNGFSGEFRKLVKAQDRFFDPIIHAGGAINLNRSLISKLTTHLRNYSYNLEVHVFIFGDNEVQKKYPAWYIERKFRNICELIARHPRYKAIICSVIPEGVENPEQRATYDLLNATIKKSVKGKTGVTFVNVSKRLEPEDYQGYRTLNLKGGTKLAQSLAKAIYSIPKADLQ